MEGKSGESLPKEKGSSKSGMTKMIAVGIVAILVVAAILGVLLLGGGGSEDAPKTFTRMIIGGPASLDPARAYDTSSGEVVQNVYETLIWYDREHPDQLVPMLAEEVPSVENGLISEDRLHYTFNIRDDVKFHNGEPLTAEDVAFSLKRVLYINDANGPAWMLGQVMVNNFSYGAVLNPTEIEASVTVNSPTQVTVNLVKALPAFNFVMAYSVASIMCKSWVTDNGGATTLANYTRDNAMGTGPFKFDRWDKGEQVVLQKNEDYWREPAKIDVVVIKTVPDFAARLLALGAGEADQVDVPRGNVDLVRPLGTAGKVNIYEGEGNFAIDYLAMNQDIQVSPSYSIGNIPTDFFADINVRKAFAYAFNYSLHISVNYKSTAVQPNGCIPEGMFGYPEDVPKWEYNLTKAAEYLDLAINPDTGNSWLDDGFELVIYYNQGNLVRQGACEILANGLRALSPDIKVTPQAVVWSVYLSAMDAGNMPAYVIGWSVDYMDPNNFVEPFLHDDGTLAQGLGFNNATLTTMIEEANFEQDLDVRAQMYHDISMASYDNCLHIWLGQATTFMVLQKWVTGYYHNPMYSGLYYYALDIVKEA